MQAQIGLGRLAEAERIFNEARDDPRIQRSNLSLLLVPVFSQQGRLEEALRMIESCWQALNRVAEGNSELAIQLVRSHVDLRRRTDSIEAAGELSSGLAVGRPTTTGSGWQEPTWRFGDGSNDVAASTDCACLSRRPEDPPASAHPV